MDQAEGKLLDSFEMGPLHATAEEFATNCELKLTVKGKEAGLDFVCLVHWTTEEFKRRMLDQNRNRAIEDLQR